MGIITVIFSEIQMDFLAICGKTHKRFLESFKSITHLYYIEHHAPNLLSFSGLTSSCQDMLFGRHFQRHKQP